MLPMHSHILIPTDGSELSGKTVEYGVALAKSVGARVTGLTVSRPLARSSATRQAASARERVAAAAAGRLARITEAAAKGGVDCDVVHAQHRHPYKAIIDTANSKGCDLIVMASHGRRGITALVLGSETVKVLTHSQVPVLVFRGQRSALIPDYFAAS
jgi:nucleotide-binding universal stress UspA family protein